MQEKIIFPYLYGNEAEKYSYYQIPKTLTKNEYFSKVSLDAKLLYAFMLDRAHLSKENGNAWCEEDGRIFIYYSAESIMNDMCCKNEKATKLKKELINIGLIRCRGLMRQFMIFVHHVTISLSHSLRKRM